MLLFTWRLHRHVQSISECGMVTRVLTSHAGSIMITIIMIGFISIATYHSHGESQTALQSIITLADQLIPYNEMLSLQTFTSKCFQRT